MAIIKEDKFHEAIHISVGSPLKRYAKRGPRKSNRRIEKPSIHASDWASTLVNLTNKTITINVKLDFQQNKLTLVDYLRLRNLAIAGIQNYWRRGISLGGDIFSASVKASHQQAKSIDIDLKISKDPVYARSHNSGIIDATLIYNEGYYGSKKANADNDFKLVAAHEFGHSVLEFFGGSELSWGHKGSTGVLLQSANSSATDSPLAGEIDLMKYYTNIKHTISNADRYTRTIVDEIDIKRLIWMSDVSFTK